MEGLRLEGIRKTFPVPGRERAVALDGVSLSFCPNELCVLMGRNGAGKSTLFDVIGGQIRPDEGTVSLGGELLDGWPSFRRARRITRIYQSREAGVPRSLRVEEALELALRREKVESSERIMRDVLERTRPGLSDVLGKQVWHLSGGEHQLISIAIARVCVQRERESVHVLLLDEHVSQLDPIAKETVLRATVVLAGESGACTIMSSHDAEVAAKFGQRQVILHKGKVADDLREAERIDTARGLTAYLASLELGSERDREMVEDK